MEFDLEEDKFVMEWFYDYKLFIDFKYVIKKKLKYIYVCICKLNKFLKNYSFYSVKVEKLIYMCCIFI